MNTKTPSALRRAALAVAALVLAALGLPVAVAVPASAAAAGDLQAGEAPDVPGLVVYASEYDVDATAQRIQDALSEVGMVTATIDHQANAESVGSELRPTTLVIGGAPMAGTPLLLEEQEAGIDLPQKFLAWEDEDGEVWLGYNSAEYVAVQAGIDPGSDALTGFAQGSAGVAAGASGSDAPASEGAPVAQYEGYLVERQSDASVEDSIARYLAAFEDAGLMPLPVVDHQAGAESIGEELRPTQVTYVGNPQVGTPLIAAQQTIGIDLPTRYLAWEDEGGAVNVAHVAHVDVNVLAERHGVTGVDEAVAMVEQGTANFTAAAAGQGGDPQVGTMPEGGVATGDGSTSGLEHQGLFALGALSLLTAAVLAVRSRRQHGR